MPPATPPNNPGGPPSYNGPTSVAATGARFPIDTPRITLDFAATSGVYSAARPHVGVDMSPYPGATGEPIRAMLPGTVTFAGWSGNYGNLVRLTCKLGYPVWAKNLRGQVVTIPAGEQFVLWHGHCDDIRTRVGDAVEPGELIATIGNTGLSFGPHLHLELRYGDFLNPLDLLVATEAVQPSELRYA